MLPQKKQALLPLKDFSSSTGVSLLNKLSYLTASILLSYDIVLQKDITVSRYFFTLIHFSPIKVCV